MYISKKFLSDIGNLNENTINWAISSNTTIALINRSLSIDEKGNYIDDITQDELNLGLEKVKEFLGSNTELLNSYLELFNSVSTDEAKLKYAKEFKLAEIDSARDAVIEGGVTYKEKVFQSAEKDRNLLTSTVSLYNIQGSVPEGFVWIAEDNTAVSMTLAELIELGALMATSVSENTIKARTLKDSVLNATTLDEVKAITWS